MKPASTVGESLDRGRAQQRQLRCLCNILSGKHAGSSIISAKPPEILITLFLGNSIAGSGGMKILLVHRFPALLLLLFLFVF
jgi:hypothetical protein